jgi:hypothetical protein
LKGSTSEHNADFSLNVSCPVTRSFLIVSEESVASVNTTTLYFQALLNNFQSNPADICQSLNADKERFLKLKHNFLVQDAKEKFLKSILEFPPAFSSPEEVFTLGILLKFNQENKLLKIRNKDWMPILKKLKI